LIALVILYKANYEEVLRNISSYINSVEKLYIISNSKLDNNFLNKLSTLYNNYEILKNDNNNIGIAKAFNKILKKYKNGTKKWLLTMDQDSFFQKDDFNLFLKDFKTIEKQNLMIYSPLHNKKFISNNIVEKNFVMSSANIVNINKAIEIGYFDEKLFIDDVDHEFCFRSIQNGYKIIQNEKIAINHNLGEKTKYNITLYPSIRLYYMARNFLYIKEKYSNLQVTFFQQRQRYLLKFFFKHLLYSNERLKCIKMILRAIKDYKQNKFGKYKYD